MANLGYLQLTRRCVQQCLFCSNPPSGEELNEEQMYLALDDLVRLGYDGVILTGGEPAMSPLLIPALEYSRKIGLFSRMITNGRFLADRGFFRQLARSGLEHIHLSLHSYRQEVHDFTTRYEGAWSALIECLSLVPEMGVTCDINTVINTYNADHLHETVIWICERFPFVGHFVWNNMDPNNNRAEENPDCIARHYEWQVSLEMAMEYLCQTGRTFRAERVPLCYMKRYAWTSTETRKIVKEEERCIQFLDKKGFVRQQQFLHGKGAVCDVCRWDHICAGIYSMANKYDERELSPIFEDASHVIATILGRPPSADLLERLEARRGWRSETEQPSEETRRLALQNPW
ncbi:MAG: radical SAM protein [Proteobacteria bacterium]|jgi:MoaA/NifB/PqqE/SkfB family radical SAM enzyme|nr:radical SAM protein [Pseudomonadota bacterium]